YYSRVLCAVPFEEDEKDPSIWFLDHNYHESMFSMFKRINGTTLLSLFSTHLQDATQKSQKVFVHVSSEIAAHEVEEIGMY
ncbi:hypothetical protein BHE74_00059556, partial [Ensete ventricosum]